MRHELQLEMNSTAARAPQPANPGLAARQVMPSKHASMKSRATRSSSTSPPRRASSVSFASFASSTSLTSYATSTSSFLIETVRRLEITVTHSYKRRKHFLIDTRTGFPVTPSRVFTDHELRVTGRGTRPPTRGPRITNYESRVTGRGTRTPMRGPRITGRDGTEMMRG